MNWLLLFLLVSAAEIGLFVWIGGMIGPWWVVLLIFLTGFLGITLAKKEGLVTWRRAQQSIQYGKVPTKEILDGICIFIGGVFLFTPGFLTDITGFLLVIPYTRSFLKVFVMHIIKKLMDNNTIYIHRK
ncbi:FxsA family protein [Ornithinibacillus halotolerans]|uniref:UPF0716 protein YtzA n=1 Tax=Ornithinibacillus halotolerans TaxID=1274357 RepID=A0A916S3Q3_9BACI|nr:FxsA family protein [Ornithinibacillus halotolerans]GGA81940.1 UPF0716 protein YtzA [Ornithinibacillus halotolerans]